MIRSLLTTISVVTVLAAVGVAHAQPPPQTVPGPDEPPQERLGARAAFAGTVGDLNQHFGHGYDLTLYFTERLIGTFYLDVRIGATYFGDLLIPEIGETFARRQNILFTGGVTSEMRLAYLTLGPQYTSDISDTKTVYFSAGLGIYTVSMYFDTGVQAADFSDQHFGVSAGIGMFWRITDNWNLDFNATLQSLWTDQDDLYPIFTGGGHNPMLLVAGVGLAMNLR
jgi:opacity protein-like surface antigen